MMQIRWIPAVVGVCLSAALAGPPEAPGRASIPAEIPLYEQIVRATLDESSSVIDLPAAKQRHPQITGAGYCIAIIDTGVDPNHPALAGRYVGGWDFVNDDADPDDDHGHGTHVAGIAVEDNSVFPGLAPQANYASLKVLDASGSGIFGDIESALQWVIDNRQAYNITAVNMSLGTSSVYQNPVTYQLADEISTLKSAGVFVAAAAGNGYYDNDDSGGGVGYPAADANVVAVGSVWAGNYGQVSWSGGAVDYTTAEDRLVSHSDRHTDMLDILAPGALITSAAHDWETSSEWRTMGGTSMATPMVSGASLLVRQAIETYWEPQDWPDAADWQDTILDILRQTGQGVFDGDDENDNVVNLDSEFTRIDVAAALDYVQAQAPEPSSLAMLLAGGLLMLRRRKRNAQG